MTIIYVPRLIKTAEQAEALPPGTVAIETGEQGQTTGAAIRVRGGWHATSCAEEDGTPTLFESRELVGDLALVPVEVVEETSVSLPDRNRHTIAQEADILADRPPRPYDGPIQSRLVTDWRVKE